MILDDIIRDFATCRNVLPRASMRWALDHWDEAGPRFCELLARYAMAEDRSDAAKATLFFILHLLAEKGERAAFPALCRLMLDAEAMEAVLGDGVTTTLPRIAVSLYDGDLARLKSVIEAEHADEFVRHAAFGAMTYHIFIGAIPREETRHYLLWLYDNMLPQGESYAWMGLVDAIFLLGFAELKDLFGKLLRRGLISSTIMTAADFDKLLQKTLADPSGRARFEHDSVVPFADAIGELGGWYAFSEKYAQDRLEQALRPPKPAPVPLFGAAEPAAAQPRKIGRNDPCPCGSGKKYKKCCLE
jgi:hypothetical protein